MAYMKRNVKFSLLILLVAIFICLATVNVYYQVKSNNIYSSYKDKVNELKNISSTLENERNRLNITRLQLVKKGSYPVLSNLTEQVTSKVTELEQIKEEADQVQSKFTTINSYTRIFTVVVILVLVVLFLIKFCARRIAENRKSI